MEWAFWSSVESINFVSSQKYKDRNRRLIKSKENRMTKEQTTINNERKTLKETKDKWAENEMGKEKIQLPYILPCGILSSQACVLHMLNLTWDSFSHMTLPSALGIKMVVRTEFLMSSVESSSNGRDGSLGWSRCSIIMGVRVSLYVWCCLTLSHQRCSGRSSVCESTSNSELCESDSV